MSYTRESLQKLCEELKIDFTLLKIEENEKYEKSIISGPCQEIGCENIFSLGFKSFRRGAKCGAHLPGYNIDFLKEYCYRYEIKLVEEYTNVTRESVIKGQCMECTKIFEKNFRTLIEKSGPFCTLCTAKYAITKSKNTNIERRGVAHPMYDLVIKEKIIQTNIARRGVLHISQDPQVKEKIIQTNIARRGVSHTLQDPKVKEKSRQTNMEKRGVLYSLQDPNIKQQIIQTNIKKYGVRNPLQNSDIHDKQIRSCFYRKNYILPSGNKILVQGYEPYALDILLQKYKENDIVSGSQNVPKLWWTDSIGKSHRHFVDFYIPKINTMVEVKSDYTLIRGLEASLRKQDAAQRENYSYEIWVINRKRKRTAIIYQTIPTIFIKWFVKNDKLKDIIEEGVKLLEDLKE